VSEVHSKIRKIRRGFRGREQEDGKTGRFIGFNL
jgi:hypothetical protein